MKALCGLLFIAMPVLGCSKLSPFRPVESKPLPAIKQLLSQSDMLVVRHFYKSADVSEDRDPAYPDIYPGSVTIVPVRAFEPSKDGKRAAGAQVTVMESWLPSSEGGTSKPQSSDAFLDLDELQDLDNALSFMGTDGAPWRQSDSNDHIEVSFRSKDDFEVSALRTESGKDVLLIQASGSDVMLPVSKLAEWRSEVQGAIRLLPSNAN